MPTVKHAAEPPGAPARPPTKASQRIAVPPVRTTRALPAVAQAVGGQLDVLRGGIDSALLGLGKSTVHDLGPDDLVVPAGFERRLGLIAPGRQD